MSSLTSPRGWSLSVMLPLAVLSIASCGGGGYGGGGGGGRSVTYSVGATVTGLTGSGLVLQDNGGDNLAVSGPGSVTFATKLAAGAAYNVTVLTQPTAPSQACAVTNGSGLMGSSNVTNIAVACTTNTYTVGGTATGLIGSGLVLRDNGGDDLAIPAAGAFTFATAVASGMPYSVTVSTQPSNPPQTCTVTGGTGSGTVTNANIVTVAVVCERFAFIGNSGSNSASAFVIDNTTGALTAVPGSPFPAGTTPFEFTLDPGGKFLYIVNIGSSDVSAYSINPTTGALTAIAGSPFATGVAGPRPQTVTFEPTGKFAYVANYGAATVSAYAVNSTTGALSPIAGSPFAAGSNPWIVTMHPNGKFAYLNNSGSNSVSAYSIDATTGALAAVPGSPFSVGTTPYLVTVHPNGMFAFVPNQNSNSISAFTIDPTTGALTPVAGSPFATGANPSDVYIDPSGKYAYVANQSSGNVSGYTISAATGALTPVAGSPFATGAIGGSGGGVFFHPSGKFAYVDNFNANNVSAFSLDATTGVLTPVTGSPFATGAGPQAIEFDPSAKFAYISNFGSGTVSAFTVDPTTGALTPVAGSPFVTGGGPYSLAFSR